MLQYSHTQGGLMKIELSINKRYLLIPVSKKGTTTLISIFNNDNKIYEFMIPVLQDSIPYEVDYYSYLPISKWMNQSIVIESESPACFFQQFSFSNELPNSQTCRPQIHFTPSSGWINDPNGLIYKDGIYHLYFQHNPFHVEWGNMSWGHAVSTDLLHWKQLENVMFPDSEGTIFSGCGLVNENKLLDLPSDALLFFYTSAGNTSNWSQNKAFTQNLAYSLDAGKSLIKQDTCILPHIAGENRDPKIYWHSKSNNYYMVLYLEENEFAIFTSTDLNHWKMAQRLTFPNAWECPDLREIPIEGGGSKWMFWTADGYYYLGEFDGETFSMDGLQQEAYSSKLPYAAQTFYGTDRVISIPWFRTTNSKEIYRGMMGLPRQLSLTERNGSLILRQKPIDEYETSKKLVCENTSSYLHQQTSPFEVVFDIPPSADFSLNACSATCVLTDDSLKIIQSDGTHELPLPENYQKLSFLFDQSILEITIDDGIAFGAYELHNDTLCGEILINSSDSTKLNSKIYTL